MFFNEKAMFFRLFWLFWLFGDLLWRHPLQLGTPPRRPPEKPKKPKKPKKHSFFIERHWFSLGKAYFVFFLSFPKSQKIKFSFGFSRFRGFQGRRTRTHTHTHTDTHTSRRTRTQTLNIVFGCVN